MKISTLELAQEICKEQSVYFTGIIDHPRTRATVYQRVNNIVHIIAAKYYSNKCIPNAIMKQLTLDILKVAETSKPPAAKFEFPDLCNVAALLSSISAEALIEAQIEVKRAEIELHQLELEHKAILASLQTSAN